MKKSFFILLALALFIGCKKDDDNEPSSDNSINGKTTAVFNPDVTYGTMTDKDGNIYKTVTIGTQTWMAENLRTTKYNDGTDIPVVTDKNEWTTLTTGAYCNYNNTTNTDTIGTYGRLYNWYAVNTGKLAPAGWHVPSDAEWSALFDYLEGTSVAGGKLKETGTTHWLAPNEGATNETGFTAVPSGSRDGNGAFGNIGRNGYWWSTIEDGTDNACYLPIRYNLSSMSSLYLNKENGFSVRCVKD